jgi:hypothetical protein
MLWLTTLPSKYTLALATAVTLLNSAGVVFMEQSVSTAIPQSQVTAALDIYITTLPFCGLYPYACESQLLFRDHIAYQYQFLTCQLL